MPTEQNSFTEIYSREPQFCATAPGRAEIIGNHTDHQRGLCLSAAVDLECECYAALRQDAKIRVIASGFGEYEVSLSETTLPPPTAKPTTALETARMLTIGVARYLMEHGVSVRGFDAYITSCVAPGSGLSSSAAFECAIAAAMCEAAGVRLTPIEIARAGQYAENVYMRKPSGLLDQMVCAAGGLLFLDFSKDDPITTRYEPDFAGADYTMCVVDTKGSHAGLTDEYAAIPADMRRVAAFFGQEYLSQVPQTRFFAEIKEIRAKTGDLAALRAAHFFTEQSRVKKAAHYLADGEILKFLPLISESGDSSQTLLNNITPKNAACDMPLALALGLSRINYPKNGYFRVHGGGFAGTILAFVPTDEYENYKTLMDAVFRQEATTRLSVNPKGVRITRFTA